MYRHLAPPSEANPQAPDNFVEIMKKKDFKNKLEKNDDSRVETYFSAEKSCAIAGG